MMFSPGMANPRLDKTDIDRREFLPSPFFIYIDGKNSPETDSMALAAEPFFRFNNLEAGELFVVQILYLGVAQTRRTY